MTTKLDLLVTLSPSMPHFDRFAQDTRLSGIRVNSAMMYANEMDAELTKAKSAPATMPLYFDLKGRQLRIMNVEYVKGTHVEIELNHRISVNCPTPVLFKGGNEHALLVGIRNYKDGNREVQRLVFAPREPASLLRQGESICIRDRSFHILDKQFFPEYEIERIKKVATYGWTRYVLSYVESQRDIDEFRQYVGNDVEVVAKIESRRGLEWVANGYKPQDNLRLLTARGDLYIEVDRPHHMLDAQKLIIEKDPQAIVGSRILLSICRDVELPNGVKEQRRVPDAVDLSELAWLYDIGYRSMMLCDDLCIREERLGIAISAFSEFRKDYIYRHLGTN